MISVRLNPMQNATSTHWKYWTCFTGIVFFMFSGMTLQASAQSPLTGTSLTGQKALDSKSSSTTWLVVRHAEREGDADELSAAGIERAELLQPLGQILNVVAIYSTDTARTRQTAEPLAKARKIEIQTYAEPSPEWLAEIQSRHKGEVVMIVGHSNTIGVIAGKLAGRKPFPIAHDEYDCLLIVTTNPVASTENSDDSQIDAVVKSSATVVRLKYGQPSTGASSASPIQMGRIKE
jgi:phosphohistidine phosphatase SixA